MVNLMKQMAGNHFRGQIPFSGSVRIRSPQQKPGRKTETGAWPASGQ
jgi:hypothetical protein